MKNAICGLAALALFAATVPAMADDDHRPLIEVGAGGRLDHDSDEMDVLLKLSFKGLADPLDNDSVLYWARVRASMVVRPDADENETSVPGFKIEFVPASYDELHTRGDASADQTYVSTEFLPIEISRDLRLDQNKTVNLRVIGVRASGREKLDNVGKIAFVGNFAIDALGWKKIERVSGRDYTGTRLGGVGFEAGLERRFNDQFSVTVAVGGNVDATYEYRSGSTGDHEWQTERSAYAALRLNVAKSFRVFSQWQVTRSAETGGNDNDHTVEEVLFGLEYLY